MANKRVILGVEHFTSKTVGGEGQVFATLANDLAVRAEGIQAFTVGGAWRGTHLKDVQSTTGCGVVTPPRRLTAKRGGITIGRYSYAAKPLPWSPRRAKREEACGGHQIWASAGTLFEQIIDVEAAARSSSCTATRPSATSPCTRTGPKLTSSTPGTR